MPHLVFRTTKPVNRAGRLHQSVGAFMVFMAAMASAVSAAEPGPPATVDLPRAGTLSGRLLDVPAEAVGSRTSFLWQSPAFTRPFEFALEGVVGIRFPSPAKGAVPEAAGGWRIELVDGDQLVGDLVSIDERQVVATIGPAASPVSVAVRRAAVRGLFREAAGTTVAEGGGLAGWQQSPAGSWREEGGRLTSNAAGATIFRDLGAGPRVRYDLRFSWQKRPSLRIVVGVGAGEDAAKGYRLELGPDGMVAVRDEPGAGGKPGQADIAPCGDLPENGLAVSLFVDQQAGRLAVMPADADEPVADLTIPPIAGKAGGGVRIGIVRGDAAIDSLQVSTWRGGAFVRGDDREGEVRLRDGESLAGVAVGMRRGSDEWTVRAAGGESQTVRADRIEAVVFPVAAEEAVVEKKGGVSVQIADQWGTRLTGNLLRVEQGTVWLVHPASEEPVPLATAALATLAARGAKTSPRELSGRIGRLACQEGTLWGCLVKHAEAADDNAGAAAIAWQPLGSLTASPFAVPADGQPQATITYAEPPAEDGSVSDGTLVGGIGGHVGTLNNRPAIIGLVGNAPAQRAGVQAGEIIDAIAPRGDGRFVDTAGLSMEDVQHLLRGRVGSRLQLRLVANGQAKPREVGLVRQGLPQIGRNPQLLQQALAAHERLAPPEAVQVDQTAADWFGSRLILRTGETFPCRVEAIDERGVRVRMPGSEPVTVADEWVQALELAPAGSRELTSDKFRGLTTLPRSQRQQPPTHVLRSGQGDYLRGQLVSLDAATLRIAVEAGPQGKPLAIPRGDVVRLIWLHPENLDTPWTPPAAEPGAGLLVEGVGGTAERLRMAATGIDGNTLLGTSPVVGPCRIDLEKIDRLLIGGRPDGAVATLPYAQWKLQPAAEPRNLPPRKP
ncbi:MAG: hypothetical protein ACKO6B_03800 [Planctomycetia bacterium]